MAIYKSRNEIPTIDVNLVTIKVDDEVDANEFGFDTSNSVAVEVQTEDTDAVKLVVKGKLRAQKPAVKTVTGNKITLKDNVFNPELVLVLQGGHLSYSVDDDTPKYKPPAAGSGDNGRVFTLNLYSAQYNAAGQIVNYEKISYPNCHGDPVAFGAEDGTFRAPEYTINSAPKTGEPPYEITYVDSLPELTARP